MQLDTEDQVFVSPRWFPTKSNTDTTVGNTGHQELRLYSIRSRTRLTGLNGVSRLGPRRHLQKLHIER